MKRTPAIVLTIAILAVMEILAANIPLPPWQGRRGPSSNEEVVKYLTEVLPKLPKDVKQEIDQATKRNATDAEILSLIYAARLRAAIQGKELSDNSTSANATLGEIRQMRETYGDQWETLMQSTGSTWSYDSKAIAKTLAGVKLAEELKKRIEDPMDPLNGLEKYTSIFALNGAGGTVYWKAVKLYNNKEHTRAENVFRLFLCPENRSGFTKGGAHYFIGNIYKNNYKDNETAIKHYLAVRQYPACLVFTAFSYFKAALILEKMGQYDNALGLLAIDVPNIDYRTLAPNRHLVAAEIETHRRNYLQAIRHMQAAYLINTQVYGKIKLKLSRIPENGKLWWEIASSNPWDAVDIEAAIVTGLTNQYSTPDDELYYEALVHEWPRTEEMPLSVKTNRILNNNVFQYKKRDIGIKKPSRGRRKP